MKRAPSFDELQNRWVSGERLSAEQERARLASASDSVVDRRELELFAELRASVERANAAPRELIEGALDAVRGRPRLRVVPSGERREPPAVGARARFKAGRVAAALALAAALGGGALLLIQGRAAEPRVRPATRASAPARAELVFASGAVDVGGRPASIGSAALAHGDRVTTAQGRACFTIDPRVDVCLGPQSRALIESLDPSSLRVRVEAGTVLAALTRREPGHSFALLSDDVSATARGTAFALQRGASELEVIVVEGSIEVVRGSAVRETVAAHSRLRLRGGTIVERAAVGRGEEAKLWTLAAERDLWAGPEVGVLEVSGREPELKVAIDDEAALALPLKVFVPAGRRRVAVRGPGPSEVVSFVDVVAGETRQLLVPEASAHSDSTGGAQTPAPPSAAALLAAARRELARGNAEGALGLYKRLRSSYPASPEAKTVLVTMGKLELDRRQPARALAHFDTYLASGGPLEQEALAGKINALRVLGRSAEEKRAIERYLALHPGGFEAPALRKRLQAPSQ